MAKQPQTAAAGFAEVRAQLVSVMEELELPAPQKMIARIEKMLDEKDRERVLRQLLADCQQQQSKDELKRILKIMGGGRDEWAREVDQLLANYRPM